MKKKIIETSQNILSSVIENVKNKKGSVETKEKEEIKETMDSLRQEAYLLEKETAEIEEKNETLKKEIEEKVKLFEERNKELGVLEREYERIKALYEEEKAKVEEKRDEIINFEKEIQNGKTKIEKNKKEKEKVKSKKIEIEKTINNRLQESLLSNPNKLPQRIRKQILDIFFEDEKRDRFEFVEEDVIKYKITDDKNLNFFITLNVKEEGVVIHTRQGIKGKLNLVAVTEGANKHLKFVDGKSGQENDQLNKLVKDIMMAIKEREEV